MKNICIKTVPLRHKAQTEHVHKEHKHRELSDLVSFNPLIDYLRNDDEIVYEDNFSCPQLYQRLVVGSDGKVMMCSNDEDGQHIVGDAYKESIYEIWHGPALKKVRETHRNEKGFLKYAACKSCYYPRKMAVSEIAQVDGREIQIENYINRSQKIGT